MTKSQGAFRTISEVSDWLDTPAHVLRFWESKFIQIKPVKRAGGRRYYRPEDMALLGGIKTLLHDQGMTIKGVQKLLRDQGNRHVMGFGPMGLPDGGGAEPEEIKTAIIRAPSDPFLRASAPQRPAASPVKAGKTDPAPLAPALLAALAMADHRVLSSRASRIAPLLSQLVDLRDRMARA